MIGHLQAGDAQSETPTGDVNGINTIFTLSRSPSPAGSLCFYINGQLQKAGGEDFTLVGNRITTIDGGKTPTGSILLANFLVDTDT